MEYVFDNFEVIKKYLNSRQKNYIFLDYDGTLAILHRRPAMNFMTNEMRDLLLVLRDKYFLGIISGRSLENLKIRVGIDDIFYSGNHGLEIEYKDFVFTHPAALQTEKYVKLLTDKLLQKLKNFDVLIEDKKLSFSIHYRGLIESDIKTLHNIFNKTYENFEYKSELTIFYGKDVIESKPNVDWNKGKAIELFLSKFAIENYGTAFLGDDTTDEFGFLELKKYSALCIKVGPTNDSYANFYLNDVEDVYKFLHKIVTEI